MQSQYKIKRGLKIYSVAESARNLPLALRNNRNRYHPDEFFGLSPEKKLLKAIFGNHENLADESEVLPKLELPTGNIPQEESHLSEDIYSGNRAEGDIKETELASENNTSEMRYRNNRKILKKKKYSAMLRDDLEDIEDFLASNENFNCNYASIKNSLSKIRC